MEYCTSKVSLKEKILENFSEEDIFRNFIPSFKRIKLPFSSELREETKPSCHIFINRRGRLTYKDFGDDTSTDCFGYVMNKYRISFPQCLELIKSRMMNFADGCGTRPVSFVPPSDSGCNIRICPIEFSSLGKNYWISYCIDNPLLEFYEVFQIEGYYINDYYISIPRNEISFAYAFGNYKYKILRPYQILYKWISNCSGNIMQGHKQLDSSNDLLIITKALKDVMVLRKLNINSIAPQAESCNFDDFIYEYKSRYEKIILYYDNDEAGMRNAKIYSEKYSIPYIFNDSSMPKDASDVAKECGLNILNEFLNETL